MWTLLLKNPLKTLKVTSISVLIIAVAFLYWRVSYLSEKNKTQHKELKRYEENFNELIRIQHAREKLIKENIEKEISDAKEEQKILSEIEVIENGQEDCGVSTILRNTIDKL